MVEQMKAEREVFEKTQEEQKVAREHVMTTAAVHIQSLFRGYWYDSFLYCYQQRCNCNYNCECQLISSVSFLLTCSGCSRLSAKKLICCCYDSYAVY